MLTFLMNAHNVLASCCGPAGNIFAKIFQQDDENTTPTQQAAAAMGAATAGATAGNSMPSKKFGFTDKQAKYEDVSWSKLPLSARKAAKAIGFDQSSWDGKEWVHIDDKHWWDLTADEKKACETLGWDAITWDNKYEGTYWNEMPKHVQRAAEKLGWTQQTWDEDWDVPTWHKGWEDFTDQEKRCLHVLGHSVHSWD